LISAGTHCEQFIPETYFPTHDPAGLGVDVNHCDDDPAGPSLGAGHWVGCIFRIGDFDVYCDPVY